MHTKNQSIFTAITKQISLWRWERKLSRQYKAIMKQRTKSYFSGAANA